MWRLLRHRGPLARGRIAGAHQRPNLDVIEACCLEIFLDSAQRRLQIDLIAGGEKQKEAQEAGADMVGGDDMVAKIQEGWIDFDAVIATPDMMRSVGKLGKVLGPRGLMPNPKTGTVTFDVAKAIQEIKAGKVEFRVDKTSIIHVPVGKIQFSADQLRDNASAIINAVRKAKPAAAKGKYVKSIYISSTMSPSIPLDTAIAEVKTERE